MCTFEINFIALVISSGVEISFEVDDAVLTKVAGVHGVIS